MRRGVKVGFIAALLLVIAAFFTPSCHPFEAVKSFFGSKARAKYEEGGYPLNVLAWALELSLGGPSQDLTGSALQAGWVGPSSASAKISHLHLRRALYMVLIAHILLVLALAGIYIMIA